MSNRLSHSSASRFMTCPKSFEFHYIKKLRPKLQSAALLFGSAIDKATTALLDIHSGKESKPAEEIFGYTWRFQDVNGVNVYLPTCIDIVYSNTDYDNELLLPEDIQKLKDKYKLEDPIAFVDQIYERKETVGFAGLSDESKTILNHANWLSLNRKGLLMVRAVRDKVLPNITKVLDTQAFVSLENGNGDKIIGYADLVCLYKGYDKPVIIDFKTTTREYASDSVIMSPQLTLYVHSLAEKYQTRLGGYITLSKLVRKNKTKICQVCGNDGSGKRHATCDAKINGKRCEGDWNITLDCDIFVNTIIDAIPERTEDVVLENLDAINLMIKQGIFTRNLQSCDMAWGPCTYKDLCFKGDDSGLIKMGDK